MVRTFQTVRGMAGAAMLAALAFPATALAPQPRIHLVRLAPSHGPTASHHWLAAERVYTEVGRRTRALDGSGRTRVARTLLAEAAHAGLDPLMVVALIHVESSFNPSVVSRAGAVGLMQLLEPTMREVAARAALPSANPRDPVANVQAGTRYFAGLLRTFADVDLALMAYNAGPHRIRRHLRAGGVPERFWTYPRKVKQELARLRATLAHSPRRPDALLVSTTRTPEPLLASHLRTTTVAERASAAAAGREPSSGGSWSPARGGALVAGVEHAGTPGLPAPARRPSRRDARTFIRARRRSHARREPVAGAAHRCTQRVVRAPADAPG